MTEPTAPVAQDADDHRLRASQAREDEALALLDAVTVGTNVLIATVDRDLRYTYVNRRHREELRRLTGAESAVGLHMPDLLSGMPAERDHALALWRRALVGETVMQTQQFGQAARHRRWYRTRHAPIRNAAGEVIGAGEVTEDITTLVEAEQKLAVQATILEKVGDGVTVVQAEGGRIVFANPACEAMFGQGDGALLGRGFGVLLAGTRPEADDIVSGIAAAVRSTGLWQGDLLGRRKDGSAFWTHTAISLHELVPWGTVWVAIHRDIHDRRLVEDELARQRSLLEGAMLSTDVMLALLDTSLDFVWVNAAFAAQFRLRPEALVGRNHFEFFVRDEREAAFSRVRDAGLSLFQHDRPIAFVARADRGVTYWDWSLAPVKDAAGAVTGIVVSMRETTPFKRVELALAASEQRYRSLVEQIPDGILVIDAAGRIADANVAGAAMLGRPARELLGLTIEQIAPAAEAQCLRQAIERRGDDAMVRAEWRMQRQDGSTLLGEFSGRRLPDGRLQGVLRDISERRQVEEARLDALARQRDMLVKEVQHRIKNHLHGVAGLLASEAIAHPALAGPLADISAQINAMAMVYGLQAAGSASRIELREMVRMVVQGAPGPVLYQEAIALPVHVDEGTSVPLALVVNELVINALKHLERREPQRPVVVSLTGDGARLQLRVTGGPARLPDRFDFPAQRGLGLGLELVATLLPAARAQLHFEQHGDEVRAVLAFDPVPADA